MVFGPGGVVALVVGAWSVLWALRSVRGRSWQAWGPTAGLFVAVMIGSALLSAHTETVIAVVDWVRATPAERDAVRAEALALPWKPVLGALIGTLGLAGAVAWETRGGPPGGETPALRAADLALSGALAGLSIAGVVVLVLLRGAVAEATHSVEAAVGAGDRIQGLGRVGAALALLELGLASVAGAWRAWRR